LPTKGFKSHSLELVDANVKEIAMPFDQWCWDLEVDFANLRRGSSKSVLVVIEFLDGVLLNIF
jgi:hypothetical protein